jgi:hypothetical protein
LKLNQSEIIFRISACFYSDFWRFFIPNFGNILLHLKLNQHAIKLNLYPDGRSNPDPSEKVRKKFGKGYSLSFCRMRYIHLNFPNESFMEKPQYGLTRFKSPNNVTPIPAYLIGFKSKSTCKGIEGVKNLSLSQMSLLKSKTP